MNRGAPKKRRRKARVSKGHKPGVDTVSARQRNPSGLERLLRWLATPLMLLALGCASGPLPPSLTATAVALIDASGERYCGAVAIGTQTLLTAGHCVSGGRKRDRVAYVTEERWTETASGVYWAIPRRVDAARDLAWLHAEGPAMAYAYARPPRAEEALSVTAPVADWAHVGGRLGLPAPLRFDGETFHGTDAAGYGTEYWTAALTIAPGWSGSPVYGEDGALIGILSACVRTAPGVCRSDYAIFSPARWRPLSALDGSAYTR